MVLPEKPHRLLQVFHRSVAVSGVLGGEHRHEGCPPSTPTDGAKLDNLEVVVGKRMSRRLDYLLENPSQPL